MPENAAAHRTAPNEHERREVHVPGDSILEAGHKTDTAFAVTESGLGAMKPYSHVAEDTLHMLHGVTPWMNAVGGGLGAINVGKGLAHIEHAAQRGDLAGSEGSQGVLDVASGGLGMGSLFNFFKAGEVATPLGLATTALSLASAGNEYAEGHGWYGQHENAVSGKQENATFLNSVGDEARTGWAFGHNLLGNNVAGDAAGIVAGGIGAVGETTLNSARAMVGGVAAGAEWFDDSWSQAHPAASPLAPTTLGIHMSDLAASDVRLKRRITRIVGALDFLCRR